jgi:hypothetical protein
MSGMVSRVARCGECYEDADPEKLLSPDGTDTDLPADTTRSEEKRHG